MEEQIEKIFLSATYRNGDHNFENENTDVVVLLTNGEKYTASFFTFDNLAEQRRLGSENNLFLNGQYFWVKGMILIDQCSSDQIMNVVKDLIMEGDFKTAFQIL